MCSAPHDITAPLGYVACIASVWTRFDRAKIAARPKKWTKRDSIFWSRSNFSRGQNVTQAKLRVSVNEISQSKRSSIRKLCNKSLVNRAKLRSGFFLRFRRCEEKTLPDFSCNGSGLYWENVGTWSFLYGTRLSRTNFNNPWCRDLGLILDQRGPHATSFPGSLIFPPS